MRELIERLERATGSDLDLDHAIAAAINPEDGHGVLLYTASMDAALTLASLLPDDFGIGVMRSSYPLDIPNNGPRWNAEIWNIRDRTAKDYQQNLAQMKIYSGKHISPAIALCIAVLKARAVIESPSDVMGMQERAGRRNEQR